MMMRIHKNFLVVLISGLALMVAPLWALSLSSSKALDAFRRYEPDFVKSRQTLNDLVRKAAQEKLQAADSKWERIKDDAQDTMDFVQKRYDLLEDLYKSVSADNPADRPALLDGFTRLDDLYRQCRDLHLSKFAENGALSEQSKVEPKVEPAIEPKPVDTVAPQGAPESAGSPNTALTEPEPKTTETGSPQVEAKAPEKVKVTGTFKMDLRNRNEEYSTQTLPNNYNQFRLSLQYEMDKKNTLYLDEKYIHRKRNELVKENQVTLAWLNKHSKLVSGSLKDTLHHVWYPATSQKDYRNNLLEGFLNYKSKRWDRLYNLGYETRDYPNYSRSDFQQWNFNTQQTRFIPDGTAYMEYLFNGRNYSNSPSLDYVNNYFNAEYNQSFSGNKSEISISDSYDSRRYGNESINLFRTSYWDNYFSFKYDVPSSDRLTWTFEDEFQQRKYASDYARGYAQTNVKTTGRLTIDKKTRAKFGHVFTYNQENTRAKSHRNNQFNAMWERKYSDSFKLKAEDTFHRRDSLIGNAMDFKENDLQVKATWKLKNKVELSWRNQLLGRYYTALFFPDYKYFQTGVLATYAKPKKFDWQFQQDFRTFGNRNGNNIGTGWSNASQPLTSGRYNLFLRDDMKLYVTASYEKTYYKSFDTLSQELLWDFTRPLTITEFAGGLEYTF